MKFIYVLLSLFIIASVFAGFFLTNYREKPIMLNPQSQSPSPNKPLQVKGSIPYWDQENAFKTVKENPQSFNHLNLFWYFLTSDGNIKKYQYATEDKKIIDFARSNNIRVFAVITNLPEKEDSSWDSKRVEKVLSDEGLRKKHISDILEKLDQLGFDGITIDYESVKASARNQFSAFIRELSLSLSSQGKLVTVALHPKKSTQDDIKGIGAFQDWQALAKSADHLNIMAYGEHDDESTSGPIASIPWLKEILNYARELKIPPEKIYLGIPLYGYDWNKDNDEQAEGLTYTGVLKLKTENNLEEKWDRQSKSPYFNYEEDGDEHEVWFENARSVEEKINLAKNAGLAGITFWRLGGEDPEIWTRLELTSP